MTAKSPVQSPGTRLRSGTISVPVARLLQPPLHPSSWHSPPDVAWINSVPSASPRNRGTGTHGGQPLPVPAGCLAPAAPALPTLQPPGSNWIQVFIAERGNTGRWPRGHGERGPSLPAARLSPRAVCSAPRAMGRQTRPCRREQNQGKQRLAQPRRAEFGASRGPSSLRRREHSSEHSLHGSPVPPCPRRVVAGPWTWEAPAAPRVLGPKQRPEVKVLNGPCWPEPAGGLGGTLPGRAEHPGVPRGARVS